MPTAFVSSNCILVCTICSYNLIDYYQPLLNKESYVYLHFVLHILCVYDDDCNEGCEAKCECTFVDYYNDVWESNDKWKLSCIQPCAVKWGGK